jgi:uncharacterized coiled-coil DUF342 family protein
MMLHLIAQSGVDAETSQLALAGAFAFLFLLVALWSQRGAKAEIARGRAVWVEKVSMGLYRFGNRGEAANDLAERITSGFWYPLLSRLTGIAPLLGVLVTTILFWLSPGSGTSEDAAPSTAQTLVLLKPVFLGVFLGALLAILNQLFVIRIERLASSTVLETIEGTDPAMLGAAGSIFAPITAELDAFVDKLGQSGAMLGDLTTRVHEAGALLTTAAGGHYAEVNKSAKDFRDKVKTLASVVTATKDHLTTYLSETSSSVNEVRATLSESLAVTRSMAERSADSLSEHGRQLESSAARIAEATKTGLDRVFAAHAATIQDRVERGRSSLDDVHGKLALAMQPISDLVATIEGLQLALQQTIDSQRNDAGSRATLEAALQTQATAGREMADKIDRLSRMIGAAALKLSESEGRVTQQLRETVLALRTQPPTPSVPLSPTATSTPASHVPPVQAGRPT